jgi:hypothetical protein
MTEVKADKPVPTPSPTAHELPLGERAFFHATVISYVLILGSLTLCAVFLIVVLKNGGDPILVRIILSCIGCFIAIALAAWGFALFTIGAEGTLKARLADPAKQRAGAIEMTAPGLVVFVCAVIALYLSLRMKFDVDRGDVPTTTGETRSAPLAPLGGEMKPLPIFDNAGTGSAE